MPEAVVVEAVEKRATIKDVLSSLDEKTALAKYFEVLKLGEDRELLQLAMAETLNRLGNTGRALEFSLLAGQTRNAEYTGRVARAFEDGISKMGGRIEAFDKVVVKMSMASGRFQEAGDKMAGAAARMSSR